MSDHGAADSRAENADTARMLERINSGMARIEPQIIALRRKFHAYPEMGWCEFLTTATILAQLREWGIPASWGAQNHVDELRYGMPETEELEAAFAAAIQAGADPDDLDAMRGGYTGAVVVIKGDLPGATVGFRADIDALPIKELETAEHRPTREGFGSVNPGVMHACGHDGHTAMGLALARLIHDNRASWPGTAIIVFQPAEEGGRGARSMAAAGVADTCQAMLTWHIGGRRNITGFIVGGASGFAISRKFRVTFRGRAAHAGSEPQNGRNALLGAATAVLNLHAISRSSLGDTRVNVGTFLSGDATNIIPEHAEIAFELRSDKIEVLDDLESRARRILDGVSLMHELDHEIERFSETPNAVSDARVIDCIQQTSAMIDGVTGFHDRFQDPGSDDATIFMQRVQDRGGVATYALIGSKLASGHHTPGFDFDEASLGIGVRLLAMTAYKLAVGG